MGTEILQTYGTLQHELEEAKNNLKGTDESLKRLIGRDPSELPPRISAKRPLPDDKNRPGIRIQSRIRNFAHENEAPAAKRRNNVSVFQRLSEKVIDDDDHFVQQKGMISKVIVTPKEVPSREEALEAQSRDEKFKARNKRMFGALLGTLQKFQQEETKLKQREQKRAVLEKKIEEHEIKEKEEVKKERQELFFNRRKKQAEIKMIELKMLRMREYATWEKSQKPRMNFITTKSKPHIQYMPRRMTDQTKKLLEDSQKDVEKLLEKKQQQIADELKHIEERMRRNFDYRNRTKDDKEVVQEDHHDNEDNNDREDHLNEVLAESQIALKKEKDEMEIKAANMEDDNNKEENNKEENDKEENNKEENDNDENDKRDKNEEESSQEEDKPEQKPVEGNEEENIKIDSEVLDNDNSVPCEETMDVSADAVKEFSQEMVSQSEIQEGSIPENNVQMELSETPPCE
ncbi:unnamed protein product [Phaedon cochleariae]|uniref:Pinin n=1 Tax=Phaedon cochleariae TaxID=80249 RepID=A0A9P0DDJ6_PHACE|nr:unnamed protein product [Phaedon cochleariae]